MIKPSLTPRSRPALALALAAGVSLAVAAPALAQEDEPSDPPAEEEKTEKLSKRAAKGEKRLARMLEGRVAGEPQACIRSLPTGRISTIDRTAYVFGRGRTIYVQRTKKPRQINDRDTLVTQRFGGGAQLCRQDIATTINPINQIFTGAVLFEDFVPYTLADKDEG